MTTTGDRSRNPVRSEVEALVDYWYELEGIHKGFSLAQQQVVTTIGRPICVEKCGKCCEQASPIAYGIEAEYAVSILLGKPSLLAQVFPRIRDWLTASTMWTYGKGITSRNIDKLQREFKEAVNGRCCFLADDLTCIIHYARPMVCLSEDSEILTSRGWLGPDDLESGDRVLTMDPETSVYTEQVVQEKIDLQYEGDLLHFTGRGRKRPVDAMLTPDHRVVLRHTGPGRKRPWLVRRAVDHPVGAEWPTSGPVEKPDMDISDDLLMVLGWIIGDGTLSRPRPGNGQQVYLTIAQSKPDRVEQIRSLLGRTFRTVHEYTTRSNGGPGNRGAEVYPGHRFFLGAEASQTCLFWLGDESGLELHRIPRRILSEASPRQLSVIYEALLDADGHRLPSGQARFFPGKDARLADDFQELCARLGRRAAINLRRDGEYTSIIVDISPPRIRVHTLKYRPERIPYKGRVWCITVPNGTFVARRAGRFFTTGNCRAYGVTHMPNPWCPRGIGVGEDEGSRAFWDPNDPALPLKPWVKRFLTRIAEPRFTRHGFFATMIYERLRGKDLTGLVDDGKVPLVKLFQGWSDKANPVILWQDQLEDAWRADGADVAIETSVPLIHRGGNWRMRVEVKR